MACCMSLSVRPGKGIMSIHGGLRPIWQRNFSHVAHSRQGHRKRHTHPWLCFIWFQGALGLKGLFPDAYGLIRIAYGFDSKRELIPKGYSRQGHRKRHTHPWSCDGELEHSKPVLSPNNSLGGELWCDIVLICENHTLDILAQE